jgi:hypothetical protein
VRRSRTLRASVGLLAALSLFAACSDDDGGEVRNEGGCDTSASASGSASASESGSTSGSECASGSGSASGISGEVDGSTTTTPSSPTR